MDNKCLNLPERSVGSDNCPEDICVLPMSFTLVYDLDEIFYCFY